MAVRGETRNTARWLWVGLVVTVVAISVGSWLAWRSYRMTRGLAEQQLRVANLQSTVTHLDEVLTMSARMAAATGDLAWERRYLANVGPLDAAIQEMLAIAPTEAIEQFSAQTDAANRALVEMEETAFARIRAGDREGAVAILFGAAYQREKKLYAAGMSGTMEAVERAIHDGLDRHGTHVLVQTLVIALCLLFGAAAWGRTAYLLRRKSRRLAETLAASRRDHAALREAHDTLGKMHKELIAKEKLSSIGMLAAGVAHEINNPMAFVTMNVQSLLDDMREVRDALPPELADYVDDLLPSTIDGISRVNTIVRDLQQFARGDVDELSDFDLNNEIAAAARISATQLKGRVALDLDLRDLPMLHGKPRQLSQVMINLLVNASHAIGERPNGRIQIASQHDGESAIITVTDNGCGMTREVVEQVFQPFFTTKDVGRGTGLGLSVAFGIVRAHGGTIEVESEPDVGTTFRLRLPLCRSQPPARRPTYPPAQPRSRPATQRSAEAAQVTAA